MVSKYIKLINLLGHRVHERGRALFVEVWQLYLIVVFPEFIDGFLSHLGDLRVLSVEALNKGRTLGPPLFLLLLMLGSHCAPINDLVILEKKLPMAHGWRVTTLLSTNEYQLNRLSKVLPWERACWPHSNDTPKPIWVSSRLPLPMGLKTMYTVFSQSTCAQIETLDCEAMLKLSRRSYHRGIAKTFNDLVLHLSKVGELWTGNRNVCTLSIKLLWLHRTLLFWS